MNGNPPYFHLPAQSGDGIDPIARSLANHCLASPDPDQYVALFARTIQIIAMHKAPQDGPCGVAPEVLQARAARKAQVTR
jgi:hypothetical protein